MPTPTPTPLATGSSAHSRQRLIAPIWSGAPVPRYPRGEHRMYERRTQEPLSRVRFAQRLITHVLWASTLLVISLGLGMIGYVSFERLSWIDAFLNAAMLLGGMGPVNPPLTHAGKLFAGIYAMYAGLFFIVTAALLFTPILHRLLHHFHWSERV